MTTTQGNRDRGTPHLRLVPPPPPEPPRLMLRLPPGMTVEKWHATLDELLRDVQELQALNARMIAENERRMARFRGEEE